jgi:hypothetical protein
LSSHRAKREAAMRAAERRVMWAARVRRKERSVRVGGGVVGWWVVKAWRARWRVGEVSLFFWGGVSLCGRFCGGGLGGQEVIRGRGVH